MISYTPEEAISRTSAARLCLATLSERNSSAVRRRSFIKIDNSSAAQSGARCIFWKASRFRHAHLAVEATTQHRHPKTPPPHALLKIGRTTHRTIIVMMALYRSPMFYHTSRRRSFVAAPFRFKNTMVIKRASTEQKLLRRLLRQKVLGVSGGRGNAWAAPRHTAPPAGPRPASSRAAPRRDARFITLYALGCHCRCGNAASFGRSQ